jgi:Fe2+ or Zn2+ uptake regulation protein
MSSTASADSAARLRSLGLRVTPQRRVILSTFAERPDDRLTAGEVFELARQELPEVARATVYNSLSELARVRLLRTLEGRGAVRYEPNGRDQHQHFRCLSMRAHRRRAARRGGRAAADGPGLHGGARTDRDRGDLPGLPGGGLGGGYRSPSSLLSPDSSILRP